MQFPEQPRTLEGEGDDTPDGAFALVRLVKAAAEGDISADALREQERSTWSAIKAPRKNLHIPKQRWLDCSSPQGLLFEDTDGKDEGVADKLHLLEGSLVYVGLTPWRLPCRRRFAA